MNQLFSTDYVSEFVGFSLAAPRDPLSAEWGVHKSRFLLLGARAAEQLAEDLGMRSLNYVVIGNAGDDTSAGAVELRADHLYVRFTQSMGPCFLFRGRKEREDFRGTGTHWACYKHLHEAGLYAILLSRIRNHMQRGRQAAGLPSADVVPDVSLPG